MTCIICTITYAAKWQYACVSIRFTSPGMIGSTALLYLMGIRDNAGLWPGKVFCFNIQIYLIWPAFRYCLCDFIQLNANFPSSTEVDDSNQSLIHNTLKHMEDN